MYNTVTNQPSILKESVNGFSAISLEDKLFAERKIFLIDGINDETSGSLLKQLMVLHDMDPEGEITIYINSPGGEVVSGLAVFDYLELIDTPIRTVCIGTAASMGAILFLAGDKRQMLPSTKILIHDPSFGGGSFQGLKPWEIEERLGDLKKTQDTLCRIISQKTGKTIDEVKQKTKDDSIFDAEEALKYGLSTEIINKY